MYRERDEMAANNEAIVRYQKALCTLDVMFTRRYGKLHLAETLVCLRVCVWWSQGTKKVNYKAFNNPQVGMHVV